MPVYFPLSFLLQEKSGSGLLLAVAVDGHIIKEIKYNSGSRTKQLNKSCLPMKMVKSKTHSFHTNSRLTLLYK